MQERFTIGKSVVQESSKYNKGVQVQGMNLRQSGIGHLVWLSSV